MEKSLFINKLYEKAYALKEQGKSFKQASSILKKEYKALLSPKEKLLEILAFIVLAVVLLLGINVYYIVMQIEFESYAYINFAYSAVFFFVIFSLVFLALLFFLRDRIWDFISFNQSLCKAYNENSFKIYFKYLFIVCFAFIFVSVVLMAYIAYEYSVLTNTRFDYAFTYMLMEILD